MTKRPTNSSVYNTKPLKKAMALIPASPLPLFWLKMLVILILKNYVRFIPICHLDTPWKKTWATAQKPILMALNCMVSLSGTEKHSIYVGAKKRILLAVTNVLCFHSFHVKQLGLSFA